MENDGEDGDDSYANVYLNDDDVDESEDAELAEMLAKVQSIQQVEGRLQPTETSVPATATDSKTNQAKEPAKVSARLSPRVTTLTDSKNSLVKSPSATSLTSSTGVYKSQDGITTISRSALSARTAGASVLTGVKKSAIYEEKLLKAATATKTIEKLRHKVVATSPRTIGKRIETLSEPSKKTTPRKFATDDEEQHCRFQIRKKTQRAGSSRDDFDDGGDSSQSFISRMEAAERNRQKKLDLSRGENDYNARLDKKACPKCGLPQSYSEFKDKKKKCQMCGVEFRFLNAWGDIEHSFTSRMAETSRAQAERQEQIYAQMAAEATNRLKINKSAKQLQYEKQIAMKNNKQTFLDRNYTPNGDSKTKRAQLELEAKRKAARSAK
ncbi:hypothetical protein F442_18621 [Phytophthora nicotianae P10297]|uniref:Uncharacterized protein n=3 Tax=Phytophthora nicotianae TaxID=4792 RepID=W2YCM5_PHYNI|nr:hypothetical protein L917_18002 [Phytophthora nicotianae]ETO63496.1 hypothetical protein F444_18796 [Phytophthora nicotianae P1976]ETP32726.1 hypothetical protein F442_18621 [Phytophthora nicotianae P10297]